MACKYLIIGDWGTTNLSLYLYKIQKGASLQLDSRKGCGAKFCNDFEQYFHELTANWYEQYGDIAVILSGMVGADIGWKDAGYKKCPVSAAQLANAPIQFLSRGRNITIISGAECRNRLGHPDIMRGEEVQLLGWLTNQTSVQNSQILCLPGTHTKWALTKQNTIAEFLTIPSGELYNIISKHGIYVDNSADGSPDTDMEIFQDTVAHIYKSPKLNFINTLFSVRSKRVLGQMNNDQARSYLSALIIGFDVRSAFDIYKDHLSSQTVIPIIGAEINTVLYASALEGFGIKSQTLAGNEMAIKGLLYLSRQV